VTMYGNDRDITLRQKGISLFHRSELKLSIFTVIVLDKR